MTEGVSLALADASTAAKPRKGEEGTNSRKKKEKLKRSKTKKMFFNLALFSTTKHNNRLPARDTLLCYYKLF